MLRAWGGCSQDHGKAVEWWTKAAEKGNVDAQYDLGRSYAEGVGVAQDNKQAEKWLRKAYNGGDLALKADLRNFLADFPELDSNFITQPESPPRGSAASSSFTTESKSSRQATGSNASFFNQGSSTKSQQLPESTTSKQDSKSLDNLKHRARVEKDANAQYQLSRRYNTADGVAQNYPEAVRWCYEAAAQEHKEAKRQLPALVQQCKKAAEEGDARAQARLAVCYAHGHGIEQNNKQAAIWYWEAARQGHKRSQYNLAVCCHNGLLSVKQDDQAAKKWYRKAAKQGYQPAIDALNRFFPEAVKSEALASIKSGKY